MKSKDTLTQVRAVEGFHRVRIQSQHFNQMIVRQGQRESLSVQAPREILDRLTTRVSAGELFICLEGRWSDRLRDALTTSLDRPTIKYSLTVVELSSLHIQAMLDLSMERLVSDHLELAFAGMGNIAIPSLQADRLNVDLTGAGRVDLAGQVVEQRITIRGMGQYHAPELESEAALVELHGPGTATLWATQRLDVDIRGPGFVYYYGTPKIRRRVAPIGVLTRLYREAAPT